MGRWLPQMGRLPPQSGRVSPYLGTLRPQIGGPLPQIGRAFPYLGRLSPASSERLRGRFSALRQAVEDPEAFRNASESPLARRGSLPERFGDSPRAIGRGFSCRWNESCTYFDPDTNRVGPEKESA